MHLKSASELKPLPMPPLYCNKPPDELGLFFITFSFGCVLPLPLSLPAFPTSRSFATWLVSFLRFISMMLQPTPFQATKSPTPQSLKFLPPARWLCLCVEPPGGSKTSLATLRRLLGRHGVDWPLLWSRVWEVATAALFSAQDAIPHSPNSFELFGFDMMIDAELKVRSYSLVGQSSGASCGESKLWQARVRRVRRVMRTTSPCGGPDEKAEYI